MSDFFKNLKSVFVVDEAQSSDTGTTESKDQKNPKGPATPKPVSKPNPGSTSPSQKFIAVLLEAMEKNNLDGIDYLEYKQSLESLEKMTMDEATRYKSAFAMAQTMGADPAKLMESAEHYISILEQEKNKFTDASKNQMSQKVAARDEEIRTLKGQIKEMADQILQLNEAIEANKKAVEKLEKQKNAAEAKVQQTSARFEASFDAVMSQIKTDIANMKKYLK